MNDELDEEKKFGMNWGAFFTGFFISIMINIVLGFLMITQFISKNFQFLLFIGFYIINIIIIFNIRKNSRSAAMGWSIALALLSVPLVFMGLCIIGRW